MKTDNPVWDAISYDAEQERLMKEYMRGCPWCTVCGEPILDSKCYVLNPDDEMGSCVCKDCMDGVLNQMRRAKINAAVMDWFTEQLEYGNGDGFERYTPHSEVEHGF